jgi:hypothetical protein
MAQGRGIAINGARNMMSPSRELVLSLSFILCCLTVGARAADIVPLKRGYYVDANVSCDQASNATLTLFTGRSFGYHCSAKAVSVGSQRFKISQVCQIRDERIKDVGTYRVLNDHEYVLNNDVGEFHSRFCEQSRLPVPWSKVDLSGIIK